MTRSIKACANIACAAKEYLAFIDEFVAAVEAALSEMLHPVGGFANFNAVPILARYRDKICTFNDDIQGTAGVALAGIYGALRITRQKLSEQRFLFLGAGSAATGIAELISLAMTQEGMEPHRCAAPQMRYSTSTACS